MRSAQFHKIHVKLFRLEMSEINKQLKFKRIICVEKFYCLPFLQAWQEEIFKVKKFSEARFHGNQYITKRVQSHR